MEKVVAHNHSKKRDVQKGETLTTLDSIMFFYIMMPLIYFNITMKYARMSNHNLESGIRYRITGESGGNVGREGGRDRMFA